MILYSVVELVTMLLYVLGILARILELQVGQKPLLANSERPSIGKEIQGI
jgi:hypothetical protein